MAYTTPAKVKAILDKDCKIDLSPFIEAANSLIDGLECMSCYSAAKKAVIETWLAAHFYSIRRPQSNEEMADQIQDTFDSKVDLGLKVTRYGQMAMVLDTNGCLARLNTANMGPGRPQLRLKWLGKPIRRFPPQGWPTGYPA